jgi:hypothetical protein
MDIQESRKCQGKNIREMNSQTQEGILLGTPVTDVNYPHYFYFLSAYPPVSQIGFLYKSRF